MKKITLLLLLFVSTVVYSQTNGITYQAIIYSPTGEIIPGVNNPNAPLANRNVCLQFSIIDELSQTEYQETINITTDEFGMVNLVIGTGNQTGGYATSFANIFWSVDNKSLKVALDVNGQCGNFVEISNQKFETVPFAFAAKSAENVTGVVPIENGGTNATTVIGAKTNLGLENVDNTSDLNKPISTFTQAALDLKEDLANKSIDVTVDGASDVKYPTVKSVKTYVDANSSIGSSALAAEVARAMAAESTIATNLNTEISRAVNAEATKEDLINKSSSVVIDGTSDVKYPTVKAVKTYVDANLTTGSTALADEIVRATNAENAIAANLLIESSTRANADATLTNNLAAEVTRAIAAEATKEDVINKSTSVLADGTSDVKYASVKSVKTYVDSSTTTISNALASEAATRAAADASLATDIANEVATRTAADVTLTNNLAAEASTRASSDTTLTTNINNEIIRATNAEGTIATNLATEVTRATAAEATKEDLINKSTSVVADGASDVKYASVKSVKTYVDSSTSTVTNALSSEAAIRAAADATLAADIAAEASTRASSDATLTTNINNEIIRATNAEGTIATNLTTEVNRATTAEATKEDLINKSTSVVADGASDVKYASVKSVKTYVDAKTAIVTTAINDEVTRATAAESLNAADILAETVRATTAENLKENAANKSTDGTMASNSDIKFPTEKAVRTYVKDNSSITSIRSISQDYTVLMSDYTILCDNTNGAFTLTLPNVVTSIGKIFVICKIDDSTNILSFNPPLRFSLNTSIPNLNYTKTFKVQSDGASWFIIN